MNFYRNLTIRNKLIFGFLTVVAMTLAVGIFSYAQISKIVAANTRLYEKGVLALEQIGIVSSNFQRVRTNVREIILENSPEEIDACEKRVWLFREKANLAAADLEKSLPDEEAKILFDSFIETNRKYGADLIHTIEIAKKNLDAEATYFTLHTTHKTEREMIAEIDLLSGYLSSSAKQLSDQNIAAAKASSQVMLFLIIGSTLLAALMALIITRSIATPLKRIQVAMLMQQRTVREKSLLVEAIAAGDLSREVTVGMPLTLDEGQVSSDETGMLLRAIVEMSEMQHLQDQAFVSLTDALRNSRDKEALRNWFREGRLKLATILQRDTSAAEFTERALAFLVTYLRAGIGVFYLFDETENALTAAATFAVSGQIAPRHLHLGEGIAGQAALDQKMICLNSVPPDHLSFRSGLDAAQPVSIIALPLVQSDALTGLLEMASFSPFSEDDQEFLHRIMEPLAATLTITKSRQKVNELLELTQAKTEELRVQQEELQQINEELEERSRTLEQQREEIRAKNREVVATSLELQRKADELERVSTYKSEFLANMSHELRTPLNSLMILSSLLRDNREGNLTSKQVDFAATINSAGRDLLLLINDILDLSKIESGHMKFHYEQLVLADMCLHLQAVFNPIASEKGIELTVSRDATLPETITTDILRTEQILKNLLSNACKFTSQGSVSLHTYTPGEKENPLHSEAVAFVVTDTGIGIPADKQSLIFNAFQQADGSTSRTYGGTGLGLSISRRLARSMGGEIFVTSETGTGSSFTLYLPVTGLCDINQEADRAVSQTSEQSDTVFVTLAAANDNSMKKLLIVEDDQHQAAALTALLGERKVTVTLADNGAKAVAFFSNERFDCIVLDLGLADMGAYELLEELQKIDPERLIPVIIHTGRELNHEEEKRLHHYAVSIIIKGVKSHERLLNEVTLFLNLVETSLAPNKQHLIYSALDKETLLAGKKILIVDDDMRNIFSLSSALAEKEIVIFEAENGLEALNRLDEFPDIDLVLMDIMMPEMDGYEAMRAIRSNPRFHALPIIALTAKAMKGDREECLKAGASDYIPKPVDMEKLFSLLRVWLYSPEETV
ncbi:MAG TPA: response regulator [Desulfuromonadales bacterium]|nr:response regulator [Desulfuromonadales bacterium]